MLLLEGPQASLRRGLPSLFPHTLPGHFAVTGAAALTTASTRTMSTALVTIELTGQLSLQPPTALLCEGCWEGSQ